MSEEMFYLGMGLVVFGFGGLLVLWLVTRATREKPTCKYCGQQIRSSKYARFTDGATAHNDCFMRACNSLLNILQSEKETQTLDLLRILKTRYAVGQISKEEYEELKRMLEEG